MPRSKAECCCGFAGSADNTRAALHFATAAGRVVMRPQLNKVASSKAVIKAMAAEIQHLKQQLVSQHSSRPCQERWSNGVDLGVLYCATGLAAGCDLKRRQHALLCTNFMFLQEDMEAGQLEIALKEKAAEAAATAQERDTLRNKLQLLQNQILRGDAAPHKVGRLPLPTWAMDKDVAQTSTG